VRPFLNLQDIKCPGVAFFDRNFLTSIAQPKPRTHSTIVWCTICRRNIMSNALRIWHVILTNLSQQHKTRTSVFLPVTLLSTMTARRRKIDTAELSQPPTLVRPLEFNTCNFYVEAIKPLFDPKSVLLRRLFFIDVDKTKYVSVGFYPNRDNLPLVEFGSVKKNRSNFIILNDQQDNKMAECLPRICDSMCDNE